MLFRSRRHLRCELDAPLSGLELALPPAEVLVPPPEPFLDSRHGLLSAGNLLLASGQFLCGLLRQRRKVIAGVITEDADHFPVDQRHDGATHRDPGGLAVPFPRRPLRRRHREPHHPVGLVLSETGEQLAVDLASVNPTDMQGFVAHLEEKGLAPSTIRQNYLLIASLFSSALESDLITRTPCRGTKLPPKSQTEMRFLTADEVAEVAAVIDEPYRALVLTAAYTG